MCFENSGIAEVNLPSVTTIGDFAFEDCKFVKAIFPSATTVSGGAFRYMQALTYLDLPVVTSIGNSSFHNTSLNILILRNELAMCTLGGTAAFTNTPVAIGSGYIYVPSSLINTYKSAANWSTYANQFRALEDYTVDGTVTGELDETKIGGES
jgi:hypothetical protein